MEAKLHIILLPPETVFEHSIEVSKKMAANFDTFFTLNKTDSLPHLTISGAVFHPDNEKKVMEDISSVLERASKIATSLIDVGSYMGWVWLCTGWGPVLDLHKEIVSSSEHAQFTTAEPYLPHVTISRLRDHSIQNERSAERFLRDEWNLPEKIVFEKAMMGLSGEHGVFEKKFLEFDLK